MNNTDDQRTEHESSVVEIARGHRLGVLIIATILIAFISSGVSLFLYNATGTAQVDLSRPDYTGVGKMTNGSNEPVQYIEYSASGPIDTKTLSEFDGLYKTQMNNVLTVDAFSGDPLAPDSLKINDTSEAVE